MGPTQHQFNPYADNGGSILAISSSKFAVIAGDTRQSSGYSIETRTARRVFQLTPDAAIAVQGFMGDAMAFVKRLKQRLEWYGHTHNEVPSLKSIARLVQTMLYGKRFFPYYSYVILAGIDRDGTGAVYSFDPVGSYERESCRAYGSAQSLVQPFLDNMVYKKNQTPDPSLPPPVPGERPEFELTEVQQLLTDAFTGAAERHIEVGDGLDMLVIEKGEEGKGANVRWVNLPLKRD
ncbi:Proteasome subunit beta type-6 [Rhodotorula kratochvilovae]